MNHQPLPTEPQDLVRWFRLFMGDTFYTPHELKYLYTLEDAVSEYNTYNTPALTMEQAHAMIAADIERIMK